MGRTGIRILVAKELRFYLSGPRFIWYGLTTTVLIVIPFILGLTAYMDRREEYLRLVPVYRDEVIVSEHRYRNVVEHAAFALNGMHRAVKPRLLQAVVRGTAKYRNTIFYLAVNPFPWSRYPFMRREKYRNPAGDFLPPLDLGMVTTFLLSVLVMIFAYNVISRERESGTLKLMLANPISRAHILFAKLFSGYFAVMVPVLFSYGVCLLIMLSASRYALSAGILTAFSLIFMFIGLYLLVIFSLGLLVSTIFKRSATAIAVLLLVWLGYVVLMHNGMLVLLRDTSGTASLFSMIRDLDRKEWNEINLSVWANRFFGKSLGQMSDEERVNFYRRMAALQKTEMMPVLHRHINQVEHDARLLRMVRFLSPSMLFVSSVTTLAGTGIEDYAYLMREVTAYLDYIRENALVQMKLDMTYEAKRRNYGRYYALPDGKRPPLIVTEYKDFNPRPVPLQLRIKHILWGAFALICYAVIFFMAAFYAFIKTEIT